MQSAWLLVMMARKVLRSTATLHGRVPGHGTVVVRSRMFAAEYTQLRFMFFGIKK